MPAVQELFAQFRTDLSHLLLEYQQSFPSRAGLPEDKYVSQVFLSAVHAKFPLILLL